MLAVTANERFAAWAVDALGAHHAELGDRLSGGNANVTRAATIDGRRCVLRHPPAQTVSDKAAAGIRREYELLRAIAGQAPVPTPIAFCEDAGVLSVPFMLVEHIDGIAITDTLPSGYADDAGTISRIGEELIDALAAVHRIDWSAVLPTGFGRPDGFVLRQIERWIAVRRAESVRALPMIERLADWLRDRLPTGEPATIIHCDYHLDNTLFARTQPKLAAIIDWEMATIGPPLVDVGLLTMFWNRDATGVLGFPAIQAVSNRAGAMSADALARRWSDATALPIDHLAFYQVFAFWRLAAIVEGAHVLQARGQIDSAYARGLARDVPALLAEAAAVAGLD